eukprot:TRINITY_DN73749_c0_g1_i1.p1 TRINITY_DN73749_c0_g1~~TRINITY_DN73749_c0_g1_i1.p1  ORF type:complete len:362 (-),score=49.45 TRINITY_DN73749_c0_g1_i1:91-1176(-)
MNGTAAEERNGHEHPERPMSFREKVALFIEQPHSSPAAAAFQAFVVLLIIASSSTVIIKTMPAFQDGNPVFTMLEIVVTLVFTLELTLRFMVSESACSFFMNGLNIVDIIAVLPSFVEVLLPGSGDSASAIMSLRVLRLMWLIRILRLAKVARHSRMLSACVMVLSQVMFSSVLVILTLLTFLMVVSASLMYLIESDHCEDLGVPCEGFASIPASFWFSISTLTTVGYGDVIPLSTGGKLMASFLSVLGVLVIALAGALLSFDFEDHSQEQQSMGTHRQTSSIPGSSESDELQDLARDFRNAWENLATALGTAAMRARTDVQASKTLRPTSMPMLRLLEERGRSLCMETQGYANFLTGSPD